MFLDQEPAAQPSQGPSITISTDIVAYTSIAREVLAASIVNFLENLLAINRTDSCKNIGMLYQLVAAIFKNNKPLCQQLWESWESYLSTTNHSHNNNNNEFLICRLMDGAYNLSREYLSGFVRGIRFRIPQAILHPPGYCSCLISLSYPFLPITTLQA